MHDPLSSFDLVHDELDQLEESGFEVGPYRARFAGIDPDDDGALEVLRSLLG